MPMALKVVIYPAPIFELPVYVSLIGTVYRLLPKIA